MAVIMLQTRPGNLVNRNLRVMPTLHHSFTAVLGCMVVKLHIFTKTHHLLTAPSGMGLTPTTESVFECLSFNLFLAPLLVYT